MKFKHWLENRESHGERMVRDMRSLSRNLDASNYEQNRPKAPRGLSPNELVAWAVKNRDRARPPMGRFIGMAEWEINRRLASEGKPHIDALFFGPDGSEKNTADYDRLRNILQDSFQDGTTVDQAVEMGLEFIRSRGL